MPSNSAEPAIVVIVIETRASTSVKPAAELRRRWAFESITWSLAVVDEAGEASGVGSRLCRWLV